jgi:phage repressor protein C with HTH and peptisase S24 domain
MGRVARLAFRRVRVVGPSMSPTLRDGDRLLVRPGARVRPGDVVLAVFDSLPGRFVVKRADHRQDGGWWLTSDNPFAPGDSASHGIATVHGRAVLRVPARSLRPRRIGPRPAAGIG